MNSHCFKLHRTSICLMLRKSSGVESERTVSKFKRRKKKILFLCSPTSIKRAREIKNSCTSCATKATKCTKRCDACAKLLFCQSKPIGFLPFLLPSPSSLLKLPIDLFSLYVLFSQWRSQGNLILWIRRNLKETTLWSVYYRTCIWKTKHTS